MLRSHLADLNYCGKSIEVVFFLSFFCLFFVSIPEAFKASSIELSPPPGSSSKIVSVRDKFARIVSVRDKFARSVSVRDIFCGGATKLALADTNFVSRSETFFQGAGAQIRKRQKKTF